MTIAVDLGRKATKTNKYLYDRKGVYIMFKHCLYASVERESKPTRVLVKR